MKTRLNIGKKNDSNKINTEAEMIPQQNGQGGILRSRWMWAGAAGVVSMALATVFFGSTPSSTPQSPGKTPGADDSARIKEWKAKATEQIASAVASTTSKNSRAATSVCQTIQAEAKNSRDCANQGVDAVVREVTGFKKCANLCYLMATGNAEAHVDGLVRTHVMASCEQGAARVQGALSRLADELRRNSTDLSVAIEEIVKSAPPQVRMDAGAYAKFSEEAEAAKAAVLSSAQGMMANAGFFVGGEIVGIVGWRLLGPLCNRILGAIATRGATTLGAAAVAAVADGPLPIGDIIGIVLTAGGAVWCAYDIYKAQDELPKNVRGQLSCAVSEFHDTLVREAEAKAVAMLESASRSQQVAAGKVKDGITKYN